MSFKQIKLIWGSKSKYYMKFKYILFYLFFIYFISFDFQNLWVQNIAIKKIKYIYSKKRKSNINKITLKLTNAKLKMGIVDMSF